MKQLSEVEKEEILKQCLTPAAWDYLQFLRQARPKIYNIIKDDILMHFQSGKIRGTIGAERIKYAAKIIAQKLKEQKPIRQFGRVVA